MEKEVKYLSKMLTGIISDKEALSIDRIVDDRGILLTVTVAKYDMGVIIGKKGDTINSIKRLLYAFAAKNNDRINLRIADPQN